MKRFLAIIISLLLVFVVYITLPHDRSDSTLALTSNMMHQFLQYEKAFGALNRSNQTQAASQNKALLILQFAEAEAALNKTLRAIQTNFALTQSHIAGFFSVEKEQQHKLLRGEYLKYWQINLLHTQLKLAKLLNDSDSESDYRVLLKVETYKDLFKKKTPAELCTELKNFGETMDLDQLAKQIAIIELGDLDCDSKTGA